MGLQAVLRLLFSVLLTSFVTSQAQSNLATTDVSSFPDPPDPFPTEECQGALSGCECDDYEELVGITCPNTSDFRPHARRLVDGSVFEVNMTYEISLAGLRTLAPRSLEGLIVFRLTIDDPGFERFEEGAFGGVIRLRRFHVRSSMLTELPDFRVISNSLRNINVDHSRLAALTGDHLQGLPLVVYLSFADNVIETVSEDAFLGTDAVTVFDLSRNRVAHLPPRLFDPWTQLRKVVLTRNRLAHVDGLFAIARPKFIYLDFNNLTDVDSILHPNMTEVEALLLASNPIQRITEHSFNGKVPAVRFLYLDHCLIRDFDAQHYWSLRNLSIVDLSWNRITRISKQKVSFGMNLEIDLFGNQIVDFQAELQYQVKRLYMSDNRLTSLGTALRFVQMAEVSVASNRLRHLRADELHGSHGLENVQLQRNAISWMDSAAFAALRNDLHNLDLSRNRLTSLNGTVRFLSQLKALNVSDNLIAVFGESEFIGLNELSELYLQGNRILALGGLLDQLPQLQYLVVSGNRITTLAVGQLPQRLQYLYFNDNPFICDCKLLPFLVWLNTTASPGTDVQICAPSVVDTPKLEQRTQSCPQPCECFCTSDGGSHFMTVDCGGRNLSVPPSFLSSDWLTPIQDATTILLQPRGLMVQQSEDPRFVVQDRVLGLDLRNNSLVSLAKWRLPGDLRRLFLANNALRRLPEPTYRHLPRLRRMTLSGNPWDCDCQAAPFKKWLLSKMDIVEDVNVTRCHSSEDAALNGRLLVSLSDVDLCPPDIAFYTALAFGLLCFLLLCAGLKITYTRYEMHIKVWLYSHGVTWVKEKDIDKDKRFDAFISFSHQDEQFVADEIVKVLETREPSIQLCLHYRHFLPGEFIHQNILNAVQSSKRTVLVLSKNFLESEWCLMEFRAAHLQALEDKVHRIIVVKMGDLPKEIDPAIKVYLDSTTYLDWGEKYFWQKFLYALPTSSNRRAPAAPLHRQKLAVLV